jgi:hypothetical protein
VNDFNFEIRASPAGLQWLKRIWKKEEALLGLAPASILGPSVLTRTGQFPEIPNIINGPPERNASYSNEINSSMRVSVVAKKTQGSTSQDVEQE